MSEALTRRRGRALPPLLPLLLAALGACGGAARRPGEVDRGVGAELAEEELYRRGKELVERGRREEARTYLRRYEQRYPRGPHVEEVKLLIADSYFGEAEADLQAEALPLYQQFLSFYPRHALACTAQFRIAEHHVKQMRSCERDQSETRQAIDELQKLLATYPDCELGERARQELDRAYDRLACAELRVAEFYKRTDEPAAAQHRLEDLLKSMPRFPQRCAARRLLVEVLVERSSLDDARAELARMEEECAGGEELARARKRLGVAPRVEPSAEPTPGPPGAPAAEGAARP